MGVTRFFSSSSYDGGAIIGPLPNPDPNHYKILYYEKVGNYLIVKIHYYGCTNFNGDKILMYENCNISDLSKQGKLDPHFSENKNYLSPIARFEPTSKGLNLARTLVNSLK